MIAFYRVLAVSIEAARRLLHVDPRPEPEGPLFHHPVLMGLSMFIMQKWCPPHGPAQRIMMIMPVVLSGMFLWARPGSTCTGWTPTCARSQQWLTLACCGTASPGGQQEGAAAAHEGSRVNGRERGRCLQVASRSWDFPREAPLTWLERGRPEGWRGRHARPDRGSPGGGAGRIRGRAEGGGGRPEEPRRPRALLTSLVRDLGGPRAWTDGPTGGDQRRLLLRLGGPTATSSWRRKARCSRREHVLHKVAQSENEPRRLIVECEASAPAATTPCGAGPSPGRAGAGRRAAPPHRALNYLRTADRARDVADVRGSRRSAWERAPTGG